MKRNLIAPFRLDPNLDGIDPADIVGICRVESFSRFLDLLVEGVIILDGEGRILELNKAAERAAGLQRAIVRGMSAEAVSAKSRIDLRPLRAAHSPGQRSLSLRCRDEQGEVRATLYSLAAPEERVAAARVALLHLPPGSGVPARAGSSGARPFAAGEALPLYQARLEPLIELGIRAFRSRRRILLLGETGVGKTTLVEQMHRQAAGPDKPFVHVNCSSISETLFEAEMFGYERGAFTGALASGKAGFIEAANGGTLFLDEIGDMPRSQQAKLLKFLEDGCIQPVGGVRQKPVDVYVVCATNHDLAVDVRKRRFREDLYYRIAMIPLTVPPLREHRRELPGLIDTLIANLNLTRKPKLSLSGECRQVMIAHDYPGNMRELLGIIGRLDLLADDVAQAAHLPAHMLTPASETPDVATAEEDTGGMADLPLKERVRAYERRIIENALKSTASKRQAARMLGIDISSLLRKLQD